MKSIFTALLFLAAFYSYGQVPSNVDLRGDSIRMFKKGGHAELVLRNQTKDTIGPLINTGNGVTEFAAPHRVNDSTIVIGPITIIIQGPGSTPGTPSGDTIYIAAAVDTIYLHNIGALSPALRVLYAVGGDLRASNWGDGLFTHVHLAPDSSVYIDVDTSGLIGYIRSGLGFVFTADNGLSKNTSTNVQLGGTFLQNTTEDVSTFQWLITGTATAGNSTMEVDNTTSGNALTVHSVSGAGLVAIGDNGGFAADFDVTNASTNTSIKTINIFRNVSGTALAGMGGYANLQLKDASNSIHDAARIGWRWVDPAAATATAAIVLQIESNNAMVDGMLIKGSGTYNTPLLPVFASNALALAGGLVAGDHYRNGDADNVVH